MSSHNPYFNETRRPLAYFISFRCYGTWLHGDERGSVDRLHNTYGSPFIATDEAREQAEFLKLKHSPVMLDTNQQMNMDATIREVCTYRNWLLRALNVRTNHVHAVVTADWQPERVMHSFKSYATRRLIEAGRWQPKQQLWSRHGSTKYIWTEAGIDRACDYVLNRQGVGLVQVDFDDGLLPDQSVL